MRTVIITLLLATAVLAQTPIQITPFQALDARSGNVIPCVGCKIYTYSAGTTTPLATYTDASLMTANTNPVLTNSAGYAVNGSTITGIWVGTACYKLVLQDANSVVIWTQDNLCPAGFQLGSVLNGLQIQQNSTATKGGYISFAPVTYNPYDGSPCYDYAGNPVQQPLPLSSLPTFGPNDLVFWNSLSPSMPANGSCGPPLPVNLLYGLNTNGYLFGRGGLATDQTFFNSIQSLLGGIFAGSFTAGILYPQGTVTTTGTLTDAAVLGGHTDIGHSTGPPTCTGGYPCTSADRSIATSPNPLTGQEGLVAGMTYFDDGLNCYNGYYGATGTPKSGWNCIDSGGGGGGSAAGPLSSVQFNNPLNSFDGSANFEWDNTLHLLKVTGIANTAGIDSITGFIQSDGGFVVSANDSFNSIQTTANGGVSGRSFTAVRYIQTGNSSGAPTVTTADTFNAGAMYYDTGAACEEVYNGASFSCLAGGGAGVISFNSRTGAVSLAKSDVTGVEGQGLGPTDNVTFNTITVGGCSGCGGGGSGVSSFNTRTGAVTLSNADVTAAVGQALTVSSSPQFNILTLVNGLSSFGPLTGTTGSFSSTVTQNGIIGPGGISGGSFAILGTTIIDPSKNINTTGHVNTAAGFQVSGTPGVTSTTCSQFTLGICTAP